MSTLDRPVAGLGQRLSFGRPHRLLSYGAATLWFMAIVRASQRNYQDSWILAGVVVPFAIWGVVFLWVSARENDNGIVAILSTVTAAVAEWVPGLKYVQPYGNSIDGVVHYIATKTIMETGHGLPPTQVYASIPGMHAWLASLALMAGISASAVIKFGLPLTGAILPLITYWFTRRAAVLPQAAKYSILVSCLATFPFSTPPGPALAYRRS